MNLLSVSKTRISLLAFVILWSGVVCFAPAPAHGAAVLLAQTPIPPSKQPLPGNRQMALNAALFDAIRQNRTGRFKTLLQQGADVNCLLQIVDGSTEDETPLSYAVKYGRVEIVSLLIRQGANVNPKGFPLLATAFDESRPLASRRIAELLVRAGANVNLADSEGSSPLTRAAAINDIQSIRLLLEHGANPNKQAYLNYSALYHAVYGKNYELARLLLKNGANPNVASAGAVTYSTVFLDAIELGNERMFKLLLSNGGDPNAVGRYQVTALQLARKNKHWRIARLLKKAGAKEYAIKPGLP